MVALAATALFVGCYNLVDYPTTWFDEGSYLHVPQTLVRFGVYADRSSEGFRYFGPTVALGPTVMLPIAGAYAVFGIGLLQARLVMVGFLFAALYTCYHLARGLGDDRFVRLTLALLITSPSLALLALGRQVLGGCRPCSSCWQDCQSGFPDGMDRGGASRSPASCWAHRRSRNIRTCS
jgi:hypothetical protein